MSDRSNPDAPGRSGSAAYRQHHERDYIERTIATVRNHQDADNCWPQWANIFADEIERCWAEIDRLTIGLDAAVQQRDVLLEELADV